MTIDLTGRNFLKELDFTAEEFRGLIEHFESGNKLSVTDSTSTNDLLDGVFAIRGFQKQIEQVAGDALQLVEQVARQLARLALHLLHERHPVQRPPEHERPRGAVPEAADREGDHEELVRKVRKSEEIDVGDRRARQLAVRADEQQSFIQFMLAGAMLQAMMLAGSRKRNT